jgi:hypothetical protein
MRGNSDRSWPDSSFFFAKYVGRVTLESLRGLVKSQGIDWVEKRKFLRESQLWSQDFTAKLFCNVEFWVERLPKLIEALPEL